MKRCYEEKAFNPEKQKLIDIANRIIAEYAAQGYELTLRQLYYQFVARDIIPNRAEEYEKLGKLIADARLAGLIDWDAIVDRTRNLRAIRHRSHPRDIIRDGMEEFHLWLWEDQPHYVEVWVEKDALVDVVGSVCDPEDVPFFSCRGYVSLSEVHAAARRMALEIRHGKTAHIIHLGDHDPSGLDMTRAITERIKCTFGVPVKVHRVALNMNQVEEYAPPPNPAKMSDSRAAKYVEEHGESSWELDALEPSVLARIIKANIARWRDDNLFENAKAKQERAKKLLQGMHDRWNEVARMVRLPPIAALQQPIQNTDYDAE
jgi:hypothetical protein